MLRSEVDSHSKLLDAVDLALFVLEVGEDGLPRYVIVNPASQRITGLAPQDVFGKTALEIFGGVVGEKALALHCSVIQSKEEATYEICLPSVQETKYLRTTLKPVFDEIGTLTHLVGSTADVTSERERDTALELAKLEGIIPALESAHALAVLDEHRFKPDDVVVINLSGRGDKDMETFTHFMGEDANQQ